MAVNKNNPVKELTGSQIKEIFDQNIVYWNEVGGKKDTIILFRVDDITNYYSEEEIGENFEIVVSDVQAYKQFGNSVSVPVVSALAIEIRKQLL